MVKFTVEQLKIALRENETFAGVLRALGLVPAGGNYAQLHRYIDKYGLDDSHILTGKGLGWSRGLKRKPTYQKTLDEVLVTGVYVNTSGLRSRLIRSGIFEHKCYKCQNTTWNGNQIPLELEHKNGDRKDNRLDNLTLLCPNCHAQTDTYRGKNISRAAGGTEYTESLKDSGLRVVRVQVPCGVPNRCLDCDKPITECSTRCVRCSSKYRETKINWPPTKQLVEQIKAGESYSSLARKLGVTDNGVRKRIRNHPDD